MSSLNNILSINIPDRSQRRPEGSFFQNKKQKKKKILNKNSLDITIVVLILSKFHKF